MMTIIDNIMDGIVFTDRDGRVTLMNPVAEDLLAVKSFIAIGKKTTEICGRDDLLRAIAEDHAAVLDRRKIVRTVEVHHSEHDLVYLKVMTSAVTDYKGTFAGILTVVQDVTSEFKSDQLKNQYLSIVSHELRTPLTGIKTFATMLGKGALGALDERKGRVVEAIREQSLLLEHQIDKLINLGRLETKDFGQDLEIFPLKDLVQTATEPFRRLATDREIEFHVTAPDSALLVRADREDIKRALQALVENAVKFTPDHGRVEVIVAEKDDEVVFRVRDTGIGIDPRYQRRIYEKFYQVEDPLTRHHGGAGLGLCVAKGIVEAHGSKIELTSELSRGADFSFRLVRYAGPHSRQSDATHSVVAGATASTTTALRE
jgi:two-component system phosphate regulon sensor histidine kinase PhoR